MSTPYDAPTPPSPSGGEGNPAPAAPTDNSPYTTPVAQAEPSKAPGVQGPQYGGPPSPPPFNQAPYGGPAAARPNKEKNGFAITALALGIAAFLGCWIPFVNFVSIVIALVGIVFGILALVKFGGKVLAIVGIALSSLAILVAVVLNVLVASAISTEVDSQSAAFAELDAALSEQLDVPADDIATEDTTAADDIAVDEPAAEDAPAEEAADAGAGSSSVAGFSDTFMYTDGLEVSVTAPEAFTPGEYSSYATEDGTAVTFEVTVTNGTTENLEGSYIYTEVSSAGRDAVKIYDDGVDNGGSGTILPGKSHTFSIAFAVQDVDDLQIEVSPDFAYDTAIFVS
ncbi:DUF4190 domain-containing protein [Paraoerskovia marina]|uniref:DUF4190 domain-containing protein n=1 Tax=Paraoerskovia marina TaxID=545619 RepID=UPI00049292A9|nr:DUF4190 domain-containing protein [Paraoerskovia marina]